MNFEKPVTLINIVAVSCTKKQFKLELNET